MRFASVAVASPSPPAKILLGARSRVRCGFSPKARVRLCFLAAAAISAQRFERILLKNVPVDAYVAGRVRFKRDRLAPFIS